MSVIVWYVPQAMGLGIISGRTLCIALMEWNSPLVIFMPNSFEMALMKKDFGVPSLSKTSMRPVFAQKLTPWFSMDVTLHPSGSSWRAVNMKTTLSVCQGLVAYPLTQLGQCWYCPPRIQSRLHRCSSFPVPKTVPNLFSAPLAQHDRAFGEGVIISGVPGKHPPPWSFDPIAGELPKCHATTYG